MKPQDKHLQTRVEYLIKLLKQAAIEDKAEQLRKVSGVIAVSFTLEPAKPCWSFFAEWFLNATSLIACSLKVMRERERGNRLRHSKNIEFSFSRPYRPTVIVFIEHLQNRCFSANPRKTLGCVI